MHAKPQPFLTEKFMQDEEWSASDAIIQKRHAESERIWKHLCQHGADAVDRLMDYLEHIESQHKRLSRRIDLLESTYIETMKLLSGHEKTDAA